MRPFAMLGLSTSLAAFVVEQDLRIGTGQMRELTIGSELEEGRLVVRLSSPETGAAEVVRLDVPF